jgi:hypothetical protein
VTELRFIGTVLAGNDVDATVEIDGDAATLEIVQRSNARTVVVGTARLRSRRSATAPGDARG